MLSHFFAASGIEESTDVLLIAFSPDRWDDFVDSSTEDLVKQLLEMPTHIDMRTSRKSVRGPKMPPPKKKGNNTNRSRLDQTHG